MEQASAFLTAGFHLSRQKYTFRDIVVELQRIVSVIRLIQGMSMI